MSGLKWGIEIRFLEFRVLHTGRLVLKITCFFCIGKYIIVVSGRICFDCSDEELMLGMSAIHQTSQTRTYHVNPC